MTLAAIIQQMIIDMVMELKITSASPMHTNVVKRLTRTALPNLETLLRAEIQEIAGESKQEGTDIMAESEDQAAVSLSQVAGLGRAGMGGSGAVLGMATSALGAALPPVAIALIVAAILPMVLDELTKAGGVLDIRYKRLILNEVENYFSRQIQRDTQVGNRQIIIQASARFMNLNGSGNSNTLKLIRDSPDRLAPIGLTVKDSAQGLERVL